MEWAQIIKATMELAQISQPVGLQGKSHDVASNIAQEMLKQRWDHRGHVSRSQREV